MLALNGFDFKSCNCSPFFKSLEASEEDVFHESRKNSLSEPINNFPQVTVSVTNETSEDIVSKEHPKIDPEDLDVTDTLDIDPAVYQGMFFCHKFLISLSELSDECLTSF